MSEMLFLLLCKACSSLGQKKGNEGYYGEKNYLDMSFSFSGILKGCLSHLNEAQKE